MKGQIPLARLDDLLKWFDEGRKIGIDEAYRRFNEVWMEHPKDLPADPFSPEYAARYFDIYRRVSAREVYDPAVNERAVFDPEIGARRPFPYQTGSTKLASEHLGYMARLLGMMDVPEGGSILEMGVGWGNTTLTLGMLGFNVTALDIEERYLEVIRLRSALHDTPNIKRVHSDFLWVERTDEKFDAVIFFESFHHCREFERLLRGLHRVLNPGGKVYFAAEPINRHFATPWCVRLDGQSLLVARQNGWMELGFHSDFFAELLHRTGWYGAEDAHPHFWTARRRGEPIIISAADPRIGSHSGSRINGHIKVEMPGKPADRGYAVFGPGIALPKGRYRGEVMMTGANLDGVVVDACCNGGSTILGKAKGAVIDFTLTKTAADVEVRLFTPGGFSAVVEGTKFQALD